MHGASLLSHVSSTGEFDVDPAVVSALEDQVRQFVEAVEEVVCVWEGVATTCVHILFLHVSECHHR